MNHAMSEVSVFKPTNELLQILGKPALVGSETLEDYNKTFSSVAAAIKPPDFIGWVLTKDVTDLMWEIQREQVIKAAIIKQFQKEVIEELLPLLAQPGQLGAAIYRIFQADDDLTTWAIDPEARAEIEAALAAQGHDASSILAKAYMRGATQIDAIDRRIAGYQRRRNTALKDAGLWKQNFLRQLEKATPDIIDGEFTEARE